MRVFPVYACHLEQLLREQIVDILFFEKKTDETVKSVTVHGPTPQPTTLTCRCSETTSAWVGVGPSHTTLGLTSIRD